MLQQSKIVLTLLVLLPSLLLAEVHKPVSGKDEGCKVEVIEKDKIKTATLKCKGIEFSKEQEFLDARFLRWQTIPSGGDVWIAMVFSNGVHGEEVILFSKRQQKKIKSIRSSWPVEIEKSPQGHMRVVYRVDSDANGDYPPYFYALK